MDVLLPERRAQRTQPLKSQTDRQALIAAALLVFPIFLYRLIISNNQIDVDEELYFQIVRHWNLHTIPYRDIFDQKPPLLFAIFKLYSLNGESMVAARIIGATILLISLIYFFVEAEILGAIFVPLAFALLSFREIAGTNSELIYAPFILMAGALALSGRYTAAAVAAALCMNVKYTAALDLLGVLLFCATLRPEIRKPRTIAYIFGATAAFTLLIYGAFYIYFRFYGVDLVLETIARNLFYSSTHRDPFTLIYYFKIGIYACVALTAAGLILDKPKHHPVALAAAIAWVALSCAQAAVTGRYYFHYFAPVFIPLSVITAMYFRMKQRWVQYAAIAGAVAITPLAVRSALSRNAIDSTKAAAFEQFCDQKPFYVLDNYLAAYRHCPDFVPHKYMFSGFLTAEGLSSVAQSGGMATLCHLNMPILARKEGGGVARYNSGQDYCRARVH